MMNKTLYYISKFKCYVTLLFLATLCVLTSCQTRPSSLGNSKKSQGTSYNLAMLELKQKKYYQAAEHFETLFYNTNNSTLAPKAKLMQAYSLYLAKLYDKVIHTIDMFIKLYPKSIEIPYAYYLKALANYAQIPSNVLLDQSKTKEARRSLCNVISKFPGTDYAIDSALKLDVVNRLLAGQEMSIGKYYLNNRNPIAAIRRFQNVINQYQHTLYTEEALYRLVKANTIIGLKDEARKYATILDYKYPNGFWSRKAYKALK